MESRPEHRRWRFDLRSLFVAVTLVATGFGLLFGTVGHYFHLDSESGGGIVTFCGLIYASGATIGAGLLYPFRLTTVGMILGFLLVFPLWFLVKSQL